MSAQQNHPSKQTLFDFAQGKLEAESLEQVAQHIENCATCIDFLEQSANDTLVDQLREAALEGHSRFEGNSDSGSFDVSQTQLFRTDNADSPATIDELFTNHPKYRLIKQIGSGGMGAVFEAQHRLMDRIVAIKVIRPELISNSEAIARFHNEVRAAARLAHRNIVAAYDAEQVGASHILVMEFVVGESLSQTIARKGKLPVTHACNYTLQVAQGLKHAHEKGMIHRDIKPHNLMKTPKGIIKILDFGLARINELPDDDAQLTSTGVMMGTADYIAPEQARDAKAADIRSDLYSLGCTFFYLLSGEAPYKSAQTRVDKVMAHCKDPFPAIESFRADVPTQVQSIMQKLIAKAPEDRYQTPQELIDELLPFARSNTAQTNSAQMTTASDQTGEQPTAIAVPNIHPAQDSTQQPPSRAPVQANADPIASSPEFEFEEEPKSQMPAPQHNAARTTKSPSLLKWVGASVAGAALLVVALYFLGAFGRVADRPSQSNSGPLADGNQPKTIAAVFVYDQFCFGDFGPLRDRLLANGMKVITVSSSKRTARYIDFADDTTPNKRNVDIDFDLNELESMINNGEIDAIVFIGGTQKLAGVDNVNLPQGQTIRRIVSNLQMQRRWVGAIGKGVNIPYALGMLDGSTIVDVGQWLETSFRSAVRVRAERVYTDLASRVITAAEWRDSKALADEILKRFDSED